MLWCTFTRSYTKKFRKSLSNKRFRNFFFIFTFCPFPSSNGVLIQTRFPGVHDLLQYETERVFTMKKKLLFCAFNMDTACVELKYSDGSMIAIDCDEVEYEVANNLKQRTELNYLVYNDPISYAEMILNGEIEDYLKRVTR